ncbi:hypothetical protein HDU67_009294, partial [Dinochytrium kinnereticum]
MDSLHPAISSYYVRHPSITATPPPTTSPASPASPSSQHHPQQHTIINDDDDEEEEEEDSDYYDDDDDPQNLSQAEMNPYELALKSPVESEKIPRKSGRGEDGLDFSRIDLDEYSPEQIEAIYKAKHLGAAAPHALPPSSDSGFNPNSYPTSMSITIERVTLSNRPSDRPLLYRVVFRGKKLSPIDDTTTTPTTPRSPPQRLSHQMVYRSPLTYHSLLFDTIKIDVHDLPRSPLMPHTHIGRARIRLSDLGNVNGSIVRTLDLAPRRERRKGGRGVEGGVGSVVVSFDFSRSVEVGVDDGIDPDDSASLVGEEEVGEDEQGWRGQPASGGDKAVVEEFMGYFRAVHQSESLPRSKTLDSSFSASSSSPSSHPSLTPSQTMAGTILRFDAKPKKTLLSPRTLTGLQEMSNIAAAFFNHGWPITKLDLTRSLLLLSRWQHHHEPQHRTHQPILDPRRLRVATYFLRFAVATYGSIVMNFCGAGRGYVRDTVRVGGDKKTAGDYLGIPVEDLVVWEFGGVVEAFKPKFFVAWDQRTRAIVVAIRGTLNIHELLTDLCAEYEPYKTNYAHRGMLRCALWLEQHLFPILLPLLVSRKAKALYFVGHSLGASIAALTVMLVRDNVGFMEVVRGRGLEKFTALTDLSQTLATTNTHPKVYIPGTLHYIYKTSRVLRSRTVAPESGVRAVDDERPHYVVERSERGRFLVVQVKLDMIWDHVPGRYENGIKK